MLDDLPGIHHRNPVADPADHVHLVGDQHNGQLQFTVDLSQQLQNRGRGLRIECTGGFVAEQDFRLGGQGAGNADALLLATGQLRRILFRVLGQADTGQQFADADVDFLARQLAGQGQWQRDVVGHGLGRQQVEVLENHPDLLAETPQVVGVERGDIFTVNDDLAAAWGFQAVYQAQQGTFAGTGVADQSEYLAVFDTQVGRVQRGDVPTGDAVGFMHILKLDHVANLVGRMEFGSAVSRGAHFSLFV
ncbi:hypothetical protein D3C78_947680 [compost metagenome]